MTRSVVDAALMLRAIAGYDPSEATSYDVPVQDYAAVLRRPRTVRMRTGLARNFFFEGLDPQIGQILDRAVSVFAKLGAEIHEVALPVNSDRTAIQAEAYAYLEN
jgi:aspartyl-tRNA(Asn)/glutamyl-tRNA(Gln) amidotransferase subunit A